MIVWALLVFAAGCCCGFGAGIWFYKLVMIAPVCEVVPRDASSARLPL